MRARAVSTGSGFEAESSLAVVIGEGARPSAPVSLASIATQAGKCGRFGSGRVYGSRLGAECPCEIGELVQEVGIVKRVLVFKGDFDVLVACVPRADLALTRIEKGG